MSTTRTLLHSALVLAFSVLNPACSQGSSKSGEGVVTPQGGQDGNSNGTNPSAALVFNPGEAIRFTVSTKVCLEEPLDMVGLLDGEVVPFTDATFLSTGPCLNKVAVTIKPALERGKTYVMTFRVMNTQNEEVVEESQQSFRLAAGSQPQPDPDPVGLWAGEKELPESELGTCRSSENEKPESCAERIKIRLAGLISKYGGEAGFDTEQLEPVDRMAIKFTAGESLIQGTFEMRCQDLFDPNTTRVTTGEYAIRKGHLGLRLAQDPSQTAFFKWYPNGLLGKFPSSFPCGGGFKGFIKL